MKSAYLLIIPLMIVLFSCSSVRTNTGVRKPAPIRKETVKKTDTKIQTQPKEVPKPKSRFTDTTKVVIKPNIRTTHVAINSQLDTAIYNFEKAGEEQDIEKIDKSCLEIKSFAETFAEGDSLKFEAMFYKGECLIVFQKFEEAEILLLGITNDILIPNSVLERALIRLGQVYCALNKIKEANKIFAKFHSQFPNSIYKEIANCEAIKNTE